MKINNTIKITALTIILTVCHVTLTARAEEPSQVITVATVAGEASAQEQQSEISQEVFRVTGLVEDYHQATLKSMVKDTKTKHTYTEEDLYILAHVICGEAQNYSDEEQLYVGSVVLNRVSHGSYPNTIQGVVFQRNQYSCTRDGNYYRTPTERNWANARYLLENGSVLPDNVVYQSGGRQGKGVYLRTSRHYYCYY